MTAVEDVATATTVNTAPVAVTEDVAIATTASTAPVAVTTRRAVAASATTRSARIEDSTRHAMMLSVQRPRCVNRLVQVPLGMLEDPRRVLKVQPVGRIITTAVIATTTMTAVARSAHRPIPRPRRPQLPRRPLVGNNCVVATRSMTPSRHSAARALCPRIYSQRRLCPTRRAEGKSASWCITWTTTTRSSSTLTTMPRPIRRWWRQRPGCDNNNNNNNKSPVKDQRQRKPRRRRWKQQ
jgi:hypothetical protein